MEYAKGLRRLGVDAKMITSYRRSFDYPDDGSFQLDKEAGGWHRILKSGRNFLSMIREYDLFHFQNGYTLLPRAFDDTVCLDLPALKALGKRMVMNYWGTEARLESITRKRNPYADRLAFVDETIIRKRFRNVARHVRTALIPIHELREHVEPFFETTEFVPLAVDVGALKPDFPDPDRKHLLVVHAPSNRKVKGTKHIERAVSRLRGSSDFEFQLLEKVKNEEVLRALKSADIVVDQLLWGFYGVFALEAMAMGKPVICYIREDLRDLHPRSMPVTSATPETVERELDLLLADGEARHRLGVAGRAYVEKYHDTPLVARQLLRVYDSL